MLEAIVTAVLSPFVYLGTAEKRVFAPAMLVALIIALWVYWRQDESDSASLRSLFQKIFSKAIWLGHSAKLDYQLLVTNALVRVWLNAAVLMPAAGVAALVSVVLDTTLGMGSSWELSRVQVGGLYTLSLFVCGDLSRYVLHRLFHRIPMLWELHKVHHSATTMTPFTVYRMHPLESFLFGLRGVVVTGAVTGVFYYIFRGELYAADLLGVNVLGFAFNTLGANLRHSHIWLSYGARVEHLLLSPAQHQVHHSVDPRHHDRNFGSCFAFWDWVFGTLYVTRAVEKITFGVGESAPSHSWLDAVFGALGRSLKRMVSRGDSKS